MSKKLHLILGVLMLVAVSFAPIHALGVAGGIDYCKILSEADCQILVQSEAAMADISALGFDVSMAYDISDDTENVNITIEGSGSIAFDGVMLQSMSDLATSDMAAYLEQMPMLLDGVVGSVAGELSLNITAPQMGADVVPINLVMKDGVYALDVASLMDAVGEDAQGMTWVGINLDGAFDVLLADMDFSAMFDDDMMNMMTGMNGADITDAVTIERLSDSTVDGQTVAVFDMVLDYGAMIDTMGLDSAMSDMYNDSDMSQEDIDAMMAMLDRMDITMRQYIGLDDFYMHRMEFVMNFVVDGDAVGEPDMGTMALDMSMAIDMHDFNAPVDVTIPSDAMILPFEMLMDGGV
jgi:hypothetical protein